MIKIRPEQFTALKSLSRASFVDRMVVHLRHVFPEDTKLASEASLRKIIDLGVDRSRLYGITYEYDVARFIDLYFILAPDYDTSEKAPWAAAILNESSLPGWQRVDQLWKRTSKELKKAADLAELHRGWS